jgi:HEPN domain-containing protein
MSPAEDAQLLLTIVRRHLRSLRFGLDPAYPEEDWGFTAQQALEKLLKAWIVLADGQPPRVGASRLASPANLFDAKRTRDLTRDTRLCFEWMNVPMHRSRSRCYSLRRSSPEEEHLQKKSIEDGPGSSSPAPPARLRWLPGLPPDPLAMARSSCIRISLEQLRSRRPELGQLQPQARQQGFPFQHRLVQQ